MTSNQVTSPCSIWDTWAMLMPIATAISLGQGRAVVCLGELMPPGLGEQPARSCLDLSLGDTGYMQLPLQDLPVLRDPLRHVPYSSFRLCSRGSRQPGLRRFTTL